MLEVSNHVTFSKEVFLFLLSAGSRLMGRLLGPLKDVFLSLGSGITFASFQACGKVDCFKLVFIM